jgi:hypothetical protein
MSVQIYKFERINRKRDKYQTLVVKLKSGYAYVKYLSAHPVIFDIGLKKRFREKKLLNTECKEVEKNSCQIFITLFEDYIFHKNTKAKDSLVNSIFILLRETYYDKAN